MMFKSLATMAALVAPVHAPTPPKPTAMVVSSTAYCLKGRMANGQYVHDGAVAMRSAPFGSKWRVEETGKVYTVKDRPAEFDIWMSSCYSARQYGRKRVHIRRVG